MCIRAHRNHPGIAGFLKQGPQFVRQEEAGQVINRKGHFDPIGSLGLLRPVPPMASLSQLSLPGVNTPQLCCWRCGRLQLWLDWISQLHTSSVLFL